MLKKVILGVLFAGLIGVLVFGAINRTVAKAGNDVARGDRETGAELVYEGGEGHSDANPEGQGRNRRDASDQLGDVPSGELSGGGNDGNVRGGSGGRGGGGGGGGGGEEAAPNAQAEVGETVTLTATVISVTADELSLTLADGSGLVVEGRAWSYAQELGFAAAQGDALVLNGFYEDDGAYEVIDIQDQTSGASVTLREVSGRPGWAGNGRGGNTSH